MGVQGQLKIMVMMASISIFWGTIESKMLLFLKIYKSN